MTRALLVLVVACGSEDKPAAPARPVPAEAITAQLVGCTTALAAPIDPREPKSTMARTTPRLPTGPLPRVTLQDPTVAGNLEVAVVRRILRRHVAKFQYCFERQLLDNPRLAGGIVEAAFAIQPTGLVASPHADGVDPAVARCFANALSSVAFPAPLDGNQVQVTAPIYIDYQPPVHVYSTPRPTGLQLTPMPPRLVREWTPYAWGASTPDDVAKPVVDAVTTAVRARLAPVEHCFDGARGLVRAVIGFDPIGRISSLRTGGLGDRAVEYCIGTALAGFTVPAQAAPVEVACDFTRGGDAPLRVSPDAGYSVIEVTARHVKNRYFVHDIPPRGARSASSLPPSSGTVLLVAEPDAPGHGLEYALRGIDGNATLVAIKASGGAPVFLGMGNVEARQAQTTKRVLQLRTEGGRLRACIPGEQLDETAALLDPRAMDRVLQAAAAACTQRPCESVIVVGTSGELIAKDLVATTSAARRAGFHAISIGGPACD